MNEKNIVNRNKKENIFVYFMYFALCVIAYGVYLNEHFSVDSYTEFFHSNDQIANQMFINGRFFAAFLLNGMKMFSFHPVQNQLASNLLSIGLLATSCFFTYHFFIKYLRNRTLYSKVIVFFIASTIFINPFFCDMFQFSETMFVQYVGIIFAIFF